MKRQRSEFQPFIGRHAPLLEDAIERARASSAHAEAHYKEDFEKPAQSYTSEDRRLCVPGRIVNV